MSSSSSPRAVRRICIPMSRSTEHERRLGRRTRSWVCERLGFWISLHRALDVTPGHLIADALAKQFQELKPERVYLPHHGDMHADHGRIYHAALVAARPLANCPVKQLLCYETLSETEWAPPIASAVFYPTVFVDIAAHLPQKLAAMRCFTSQLKPAPNPRSLEAIEALARYRGSTVSVHAAEAFVLVRDVVR